MENHNHFLTFCHVQHPCHYIFHFEQGPGSVTMHIKNCLNSIMINNYPFRFTCQMLACQIMLFQTIKLGCFMKHPRRWPSIISQSNYNSLSSRLTYILLYSVKHVNPSHCNRVNCLGNLQLEDSTDIATPTTQSRQEHC